jgi:hypothetical protein
MAWDRYLYEPVPPHIPPLHPGEPTPMHRARLYRLLFGPDATDTAGMGGATPAASDTAAAAATANPASAGTSTPAGQVPVPTLTAEELAAEPVFDPTEGAGATPANPAQPARPADPNLAANVPGQGQGNTIREAAKRYGLDLTRYPDDHTAFVALVQAAQSSQRQDVYAQLGRTLAPQHQQIREYLSRQNQPAQPERQPWEPPDFDERWLALCQKDEATGVWVARAGVSPAVAEAVNKYSDWIAGFQKNPMAVIRPAIEAESKRIAAQLVEEQFGSYRQEADLRSIVEGNAPWLYQVDEAGRRVADGQGRFFPTPAGARYIVHLQALQQAGVKDPRQADTFAKQLLTGEIAAAQAASPNPAQPGAPQVPAQTRQAIGRHPVNPLQAVEPSRRATVPAATEPDENGLNFTERLRKAMAAEGVKDSDFQNNGLGA